MNKHAAVLAVTLVLSGCTFGTPDETATTPAVNLAAPLEAFAADASTQGASAVVFHVRNGDRQELRATGVKDLESNAKAVPTDKTWILGAGTPMVAVSMMKLVEAGTVHLDDPVSVHLPEFTAIFPAWDRVRVRDLLGSTSGLPDYFPPLIESRTLDELQTLPLTFEERLRIAAGVDLPPGPVSYFVWSATDWEVMGWLLERKHNRRLEEVLAKDVFEPAGMGNTRVAAAGQPPEPMLHGYVLEDGNRRGFTRIDALTGSADSGVISTVQDLSKFLAALTTGRLIREDTWNSMVEAEPFSLGGISPRDDICPGTHHVIASGGGGPYSVQSVSSSDGQRQVTVATVLPPRELNVTDAPPLVPEMEDAILQTARSMC
ncbi:D-alanyl-D-alanine carboxypeptidase [Pseudarthrobacter siccitolerans]|uniref:D-alanyl-D-alanine carboxypeptidase n=1 Tax=Pseudarthrobacter siccitolerans TaxID=861266 RepID=A0ABU0PFW7_9MICC|nr:serine hydrolase domain-containing protein [Pseudarthrobacter siccitolerans]MDQ0672836.1 D-alanyl-D-alanine carboxypeptidase [Pseudarthrobacter siccitolerans]